MYVFSGDNCSELYLSSLRTIQVKGQELSPRGKRIKEIRPVCFEFTNPLSRVTFLKGRRINPFFQLAESFWIISGRPDVSWLSTFNSNMVQFSDDGMFFNAPYGERLRAWNQNSLNNFIFNPFDQLYDVIVKLSNDKDTRQAVAIIYNPIFDNAEYASNGGKDIPCNLVLTFKIRNEALDLTVFNRSNDVAWGLFGANLVQFSTIQEFVASSLGVKVGTYTHITDSLHIYLEDYGSDLTDKVLSQYPDLEARPDHFFYPDSEPRFTSNWQELHEDLSNYWDSCNGFIMAPDNFLSSNLETIQQGVEEVIKDPYLTMIINYMLIYRLYKMKDYDKMCHLIEGQPLSQWKVSSCRFVYDKVKESEHNNQFLSLLSSIPDDACKFIIGG